MRVTVLIPTLNRPGPLARALASVGAQTLPAGVSVEVLVVDNGPEGSAAAVVREARLPWPVRHLAEPRRGVSTVRNTGVRAAGGAVVAFLDDDCEAVPGWLAAQVRALEATGADGSFGPRVARINDPAPADAAWFRAAYSRDLREAEGADVTARWAFLPLPGAALVRARCLAEDAPFDGRLDHSGGEDVHLFLRLALAGRRFVWAPDAVVHETIAPGRLDRAFVYRRRMLSGRHSARVPMMVRPPQRAAMAREMLKGAAGLGLYGGAALAGRLAGGRWPPGPTGTAMSAVGKLTWWWGRGPELYGRGHR